MSSSDGGSGGIGFPGLLAVLFIGLKLTHYIAWSWWWVLSPLWIPLAALAVIIPVGVVVTGVSRATRKSCSSARLAPPSAQRRDG